MPTLPTSLPVLTVMAIVPLAGALLLWLVPPLRRLYARAVGLVFSLAVLVLSLWALSAFDLSQAGTSTKASVKGRKKPLWTSAAPQR